MNRFRRLGKKLKKCMQGRRRAALQSPALGEIERAAQAPPEIEPVSQAGEKTQKCMQGRRRAALSATCPGRNRTGRASAPKLNQFRRLRKKLKNACATVEERRFSAA
jgi:hypothetical protein